MKPASVASTKQKKDSETSKGSQKGKRGQKGKAKKGAKEPKKGKPKRERGPTRDVGVESKPGHTRVGSRGAIESINPRYQRERRKKGLTTKATKHNP